MLITLSFEKSLIVEQFQENYLKIAAYDNTKNFSRRYYFELNPLYGNLREARGSALEARTNLFALDWI